MRNNNITKKLVTNLRKKSIRYKSKLFVAEGFKIVDEFLNSRSVEVLKVYIREDKWSEKYDSDNLFEKVSTKDFKKISSLETAQGILAVVKMPAYVDKPQQINFPAIVLENISDPGNLGTIIRTADWFGIDTVICSQGSVDVFSPKTVQASMGAVARVKVYYENMQDFFAARKEPVYALSMHGDNIYETPLKNDAFYLFGSEAHGISTDILKFANKKLTIPNFSKNAEKTESLNLAMSVGITLALMKRYYK